MAIRHTQLDPSKFDQLDLTGYVVSCNAFVAMIVYIHHTRICPKYQYEALLQYNEHKKHYENFDLVNLMVASA